jgi:signal transduction histidine kinase
MGPAVPEQRVVSDAEPNVVLDHEAEDAVAVVCHRLRTPLTAALGFLQLAIRDVRNDDAQARHFEHLELVDQQLRRMTAMLDDLARKAVT